MSMDLDGVCQYSHAAQTALTEEYERTEAEADAFAAFRDRVTTLDVSQLRPDGGIQITAPLQVRQQFSHPSRCEQVCQAYRETILSMPHYTAEYDESLRDHMAAEFGRDLVVNVFEGSQLTPQLQQALVDASQQAHDQREELRATLDAEAEALDTAQTTLREIGTTLQNRNAQPLSDFSFAELRNTYELLEEAEDRCQQVACERQHALHADEWACPGTAVAPGVQPYLYRELAITYPILADVAECCRLLRRARTRVIRTLATTP
jgi:hypothetical protein